MKQHTVMTACILLCLLALVSEAHPQGRHGERRINTILERIQRSGICEEYNAATEEEKTTCSDEFVNGLLPRRSPADIVASICLEGGVTATSACVILDIVCATDTTGTSTLETCPRSQAHPQGRHGERRINTILGRIQRSGICEEYNAATEEEKTTCSDEFVNGLLPRRSPADIVASICLEGGVTATSACVILDIVCDTDITGTSTLELCPRTQGNRKRRDDSEVDSGQDGDDDDEAEEPDEADVDAAEGGTGTGADGIPGTAAGVTDSAAADAPGAAATPAGTPAGTPGGTAAGTPAATPAGTAAGTPAATPVPNP
eukprot:XP_003726094.1 PREDICTED: uncharacterized protein LOC100889463 [Strongylocentrotus purpuratus]